MVNELRPPVSLKFDTEKEKDLIEKIKGLKHGRDLTTLCEYLLRIFLETPETLRDIGETKDVLQKIDELGMTPARYNFFSQVAKEVNDMKDKVDAIYTMMYKTYILALAGKRLGLEQKAETSLRATFILEKQIADLSRALGVDSMNHTFVSNKIQNTEQMASEVMDCIISSYDSIIEELKDSLRIEASMAIPVDRLVDTSVINEKNVERIDDTDKAGKKEAEKQDDNEDDYIQLPEKPRETKKDDDIIIPELSGDKRSAIMDLMS